MKMVGNTPQKQQGQMKSEPKSAEKGENKQEKPDHKGQQGGGGGPKHFNRDNRGGDFKNERNRSFGGNRRQDNRGGNGGGQGGGGAAAASQAQSSDDSTPAPPKKFTGRCRLFVGNLPLDFTEDDFKGLFEPFGEHSEAYVNGNRGFGFIRMDFRHNAEAAKAGLDGTTKKGRTLRVRFATHGAALKVKNLHPTVSNELLEQGFAQFGELERAVVIVDDRGKSTGEGIVEFVRKPGAQQALRRINEGVFLLGTSPRPVIVEPLEQKDDEDGMPDKFINKNDQYKKEREKEPRFAQPGTFDYEMGMRWKQMENLEKEKLERVKKEMEEAQIKLEDDMQNALYDYQAEQIRQDLMRQQEELRRLEELKQQDQMRRRQEMEMRNRDEERMRLEEDRRRQDMMMRQQNMGQGGPGRRGPPMMEGRGHDDGMNGGRQGGAPPMQPPPIPPAGMGLNRPGNQVVDCQSAEQPDRHPMMGGNSGGQGRGPSMPGGSGNQGPMRQSRFDQTTPNFEGGMGGPPGPRGNMYGGNMGGGPGMRGGERGMMERRREGGQNEDFGELKRMRRF
ncbi:paraspeckle component 1 isoform X2 [Patella vulgata]|uniref:paraspeckle component 1 isoform X2 n=1 Tax=Patella vulgata TaxID=6465 RepID=UPI00217FC22A|nr:paraspeckle component 1 isoform X2 [Patella vulgata]